MEGKDNVQLADLEVVAEAAPQTNLNVIGIVHKMGPIGQITLKTGENKHRRNIVIVDDTNLSCVICFWSDKHLTQLDHSEGKVVAVMAARASDFSHKSLNASEDSRVYVEPAHLTRTDELRIWYEQA